MTKFMRFISLCVLVCFVGSLGAPFAEAQTSSQAAAATLTQGAQTGLSNLWFAWKDLFLKAAKPTMDQAAAISWFKSNGATAQQAELLALNAAAEGQLVTKVAASPSAPVQAAASSGGNVFTRFFNSVMGKSAPATEVAATQSGLLTQLKSAAVAGTQGYPTPASFTGSTPAVQGGVAVPPSQVQITPQDIAAGITSTAQKAKIMMGMEAAPATAPPATGFFAKFKAGVANVGSKIKAGAEKVGLTVKRGTNDAATIARTGVLTAADKVAFWQNYYKIPVTDNLGIKVRGELSYTTKFTNKGWVVDSYSSSTNMPGKGEAANALFQIDQVAAATQPAKMGFFSNIASKIKAGWTGIKGTITGHKPLTENAKAELGKIQIENQLLEKARTLNEVSASVEQRISNLEQTAKALRRDVPADEIKALRDTQEYVNQQKKALERKLTEVHDGKAMTVVKDAAKWALYSIGITAGVNIAKQVFSGEGIDLKAAFSFMGQPQFWGGMAGGFAGSMAGAYLGNMLLGGLTAGLPAGIGLFMRVIPGFLGAALGFEIGGSFFGGQMDIVGSIVQTMGSALGYTGASMIWTAMMGTAAPGLVLVAAAIAAGMLTSWIFNKFRGDPTMDSTPLPLPDQNVVPTQSTTDQVPPVQVNVPQSAASLAELQQKRSEAYTKYINLLKERKIPEARTAREEYEQIDNALKAQINASSN